MSGQRALILLASLLSLPGSTLLPCSSRDAYGQPAILGPSGQQSRSSPDLQQEIDRLRRRGQSLREQLRATRDERDRAERERQASHLRIHQLEQESRVREERLEAQRRTLRSREAELQEAREQIADLRAAVRKASQLAEMLLDRESRIAALERQIGTLAKDAATRVARDPGAASPTGESTAVTSRPTPAPADLLEQLDIERQRRFTLEAEIQRLAAYPDRDTAYEFLVLSLRSARAEILVLSNRLAEEQRRRETLEVAIERVRRIAHLPDGTETDAIERLAETMVQRRADAERLAQQLRNANEAIVSLKGRLEAVGASERNGHLLAELEAQNRKLSESLEAAQAANRELREKAALAERLAEMLYANTGG